MKNLFLLTMLLVHGCLCPGIASAQTTPKVNSDTIFEFIDSKDNFILNPFARMNTNNISVGGSATKGRVTGASRIKGIASHTCTGTAAGSFCQATIRTPTAPYNNPSQRCEYTLVYSGTGASGYVLAVGDQTVALENTVDLTEYKIAYIEQPCSSSPTPPQVKQPAAGTPGVIHYGLIYGRSGRLGQVNQATFYGGAQQEGAANCLYAQNTSTGSNNYIDLGTAGSCAQAWSSYGNCTAVGPTSHQITCANMPPGDYKFEVSGAFVTTTSGNDCNFKFSDSTNQFGYNTLFSSGTGAASNGGMMGRITYNTAGTRTFKIQSSDNGMSAACRIDNSLAGMTMVWRIWRFPTSTQTVATIDNLDYAPRPYTPVFTGFGTPTNVECLESRDGSYLDIDCRFQAGTTTAVEGRIGLPAGLTGVTMTQSPKLAGGMISGYSAATRFGLYPMIESASTYLVFGAQDSAAAATAKANANQIPASTVVSFKARVQIQGWQPAPSGVINISPPVFNTVTLGGSGNYTVPPGITLLEMTHLVGGGGGGGGAGSAAGTSGGAGGNTTFGNWTAAGGTGAAWFVQGVGGGIPSVGTGVQIFSTAGGSGQYGGINTSSASGMQIPGGTGGDSCDGQGGQGGGPGGGGIGSISFGGGGGGGGTDSAANIRAGGGGGAGGCVSFLMPVTPGQIIPYSVGAAGTAGAAGTGSTRAGGPGRVGTIRFKEHATSFLPALASGLLSKIPGSLTSNSQNASRFEWARIQYSPTSCDIQDGSGAFTTSRTATGICSITQNSPAANILACTCSLNYGYGAGNTPVQCITQSVSDTVANAQLISGTSFFNGTVNINIQCPSTR